jgi:hypothetical protein
MPASVPTPTVWTRMPRSAAATATDTGSGRAVFSPSLNRTMTAFECLPGSAAGGALGSGDRLL